MNIRIPLVLGTGLLLDKRVSMQRLAELIFLGTSFRTPSSDASMLTIIVCTEVNDNR